MTRLNYALFMGVCVAALSMWFGWTSSNPNWLTLNPPLGLLAGFTFGWLAWTVRDWLDRR